MIFVVAVYGGKLAGMLLAHLRSIQQTHPGAAIQVYHQDMPARIRDAVIHAHPAVRFIETKFDFANDHILRVSSKTMAWEQAAQHQPAGEKVCFLDVDTLVRGELGSFFDPAYDVVFTDKPEGFLLNTGVLLLRVSQATLAFVREWRARTIAILRDPDRFRLANDPQLPFGAADQMALYEILDYDQCRRDYTVTIGADSLRFHAVPASILNETRSRTISPECRIIHYKGGWQPILLLGWPFSAKRSRADCAEMYRYYLETFEASLKALNHGLGERFRASDFHLWIPRYVNARYGIGFWYGAYCLGAHFRRAFAFLSRAWQFFRRKAGCRLS